MGEKCSNEQPHQRFYYSLLVFRDSSIKTRAVSNKIPNAYHGRVSIYSSVTPYFRLLKL